MALLNALADATVGSGSSSRPWSTAPAVAVNTTPHAYQDPIVIVWSFMQGIALGTVGGLSISGLVIGSVLGLRHLIGG